MFINLDVKTHSSFFSSSIQIPALIKACKEKGQNAIAINDYGNVFNAIPFYIEAKKNGIKPILGCEFNIVGDCKETKDNRIRLVNHIKLLALNNKGWENITRLASKSNMPENFYFRPRIDMTMLQEHSEGIVAICGGVDDIITSHLHDRYDEYGDMVERAMPLKAQAYLRRLINIFGKKDIYLQIQSVNSIQELKVTDLVRATASKYGISVVATGSAHYLRKEDSGSHKALVSMGYNAFNKTTNNDFSTDGYYLRDSVDFADESEINMCQEIADRCNVDIDLTVRRLPKYTFTPEGTNNKDLLKEFVRSGYVNRGIDSSDQNYIDRVKRELADIDDMGFNDYFLIMNDICQWMDDQKIQIGYGRGSSAGSLISYCLGITNVDPLKYGLLWERFLNKGRGGLPDIDTDVPKSRRKDVLDYIKQRFGEDNVAQIITFNKLSAKSVLKDVFRLFDMPFDEANKITACVPDKNEDHTAVSLSQAISMVPALQEYEKTYSAWFKIARDLEGCYRGIGTHAAAVVVSDVPFSQSSYPLCRDAKGGGIIFAYDMNVVDKMNLLKLDILGLSTLDDVSLTRKIILDRSGVKIDRETMPLDDLKTYSMFHEGKTGGVFQLEKSLGKTWSKKVCPDNINEIAALTSMVRPGPLEAGLSDLYVNVKFGAEPEPLHELMRDQLSETYSATLYQEQIIMACKNLAGMDLYDADSIRKALGKKIPSELDKWKVKFVNGCKTTSNISEEVSSDIWHKIEKFAGYSFNASHAFGYGLLSYETAYLKANHTIEFFCAKLRNSEGAADTMQEIKNLINDAKLFGITIVPPSLQYSNEKFDIVDDKTIAFGLGSLKGIGKSAIGGVIRLNCTDFDDFLSKSKEFKVNKAVVEGLIKSGCLDYFGVQRIQMMAKFALFQSLTVKEADTIKSLSIDLEDAIDLLSNENLAEKAKIKGIKIPNKNRRRILADRLIKFYSSEVFDKPSDIINWEKNYLGITISCSISDMFESRNLCRDIVEYLHEGSFAEVIINIDSYREIITKKGDPMCFITGGDDSYVLDNIVVFPKQFERFGSIISNDSVLRARGRIDDRGSFIITNLEKMT